MAWHMLTPVAWGVSRSTGVQGMDAPVQLRLTQLRPLTGAPDPRYAEALDRFDT